MLFTLLEFSSPIKLNYQAISPVSSIEGIEMKQRTAIVLLAISLTSCAIGYQKFNVMSGGYKDNVLEDGTISVSYEMYGQASPELVLERWHMRSSELCPEGYEVVELVRDDIKTNTASTAGGIFVPLSSSDPKYKGQIKCKG